MKNTLLCMSYEHLVGLVKENVITNSRSKQFQNLNITFPTAPSDEQTEQRVGAGGHHS
jgi:hypothetical protein